MEKSLPVQIEFLHIFGLMMHCCLSAMFVMVQWFIIFFLVSHEQCTQCFLAVNYLKLRVPRETRDERNEPVNQMIDRPCPIAATAPVSMPSLSDDFLRAESSRLIGRRKPRQLSPLLYLTVQKQRPGICDRGNERGWSRYGQVVVVVAACLGG